MKKWLVMLLCAFCLSSAIADEYDLPGSATCCPYVIEEVHYGYDSQGDLVVKGLSSLNYLNYIENEYGVSTNSTRILTEIDGQPVTRVQSKYFGHFDFSFFDSDEYNNAAIEFMGEGKTLPLVDLSEWGNGSHSSNARVVLPANITELDLNGRESFLHDAGVFEVHPDNPVFESIDGALYRKEDHTLLICNKTWWPTGTIAEGTLRIASFAFETAALEELMLPEGLLALEDHALANSDIGHLSIPASLKEIGEMALPITTVDTMSVASGNPLLLEENGLVYDRREMSLIFVGKDCPEPINIHPDTTRIGKDAFMFNALLTTLTLPEGLCTLEDGALSRCLALQTLTLPATLENIGTDALPGGYWPDGPLQSIVVAKDNPRYKVQDNLLIDTQTATLLRVIGEPAHVTVPAGIRAIDKYAFFAKTWFSTANFPPLDSISLPLSITAIAPGTFASQAALTKISLPLTLERIGDYAFSQCVSLQSFQMPPSVTCIGKQAFYNCAALTEIHLPDGLAFIDETAFDFTNNLIIYAHAGTVGHQFAQTQGMRWAEPGGTPVQLAAPPATRPSVAVINCANASDTAALYAQPDEVSEVIATFANGTPIFLKENHGNWQQVALDKTEGYIQTSLLMPMDTLTSVVEFSYMDATKYSSQDGEPRPYFYAVPDFSVAPYSRYDEAVCDVEYPVGPFVRANDAYYPVGLCDLYYHDDGSGRDYGYVVNEFPTDRLNLREAPDTRSKSLGRYFTGTQMEILGEMDGWLHVQLDGKKGYVMEEFMRRMYPDTNDKAK